MVRGAAIIPAAGSGSRMQSSCPKQFLTLGGRPVLIHAIEAFHRCGEIGRIVVVVARERIGSTEAMIASRGLAAGVEVIEGGVRRQDSVQAGLSHIAGHGDGDVDVVLVHDGARPLVQPELIRRCLEAAAAEGAAIAAVPVKDTLKRGGPADFIAGTVSRDGLWQAQTPQAARPGLLQQAFAAAAGRNVTDEAQLLEMASIPVKLVPGAETNIKITRPEDLAMAERLLMNDTAPTINNTTSGRSGNMLRIGHGFDAHRFAEGRRLVLGGVKIPHHQGLAGHSDADVLTHAVCDAILGALGRGDIGHHFPDSQAEFKDIHSIRLLERVAATMDGDGFAVANIDVTVVCQAPRLGPFMDEMVRTIARACKAAPSRINIKATTTEKMGYTGREEGISCHAVVLLTPSPGE